MSLLRVIFFMAMSGGPVWAGLPHVPAVTCGAQSCLPLTRIEVVGGVAGFGSLPRLANSCTSAALPAFGPCNGSRSLAGTLPWWLAAPRNQPPLGGDLPRFPGICGIARQQVDPFLTWFDIWSGGALGELRTAALGAAKRGDDSAYRALAAKYWAGLAVATERRRVLAGKTGSGSPR